jgi:rhodanese-related sulfurtransferase
MSKFRIVRTLAAVILFFVVAINCKIGDNQSPSVMSEAADQVAPEKVDNIDVTTFKEIATSGDENVVILDVRTPGEHAAGNVPNSTLIDVSAPDFKSKVAGLDKDKTYLVYCRSGRRSVAATDIMTKELGFTNVKNLLGGYLDYARSN